MIKLVNAQNSDKPAAETIQKVENIPVNLIKPNPYQPRKSFSAQSLDELAQSIKEYGVIQPITVRRSGQDGYELIAGERRLRAAKLIGLETIPAIIVNSYEQDSAMIAMIENLQRENLHFLEEAKGYASLIKDHNFTQEELASKLGKNQSTIANKLRLLRLSDNIKEFLVKEDLTERHARALLKLPDDELRLKALRRIAQYKLNVRDSEDLIDKMIERIQRSEPAPKKEKPGRLFRRTKDMRVYINTIRSAVNMLKDYGLTAKYTQVEKEDCIEITVIIPKG